MVLSKRLLNVAKQVTSCELLIDIGTDHAYVPIYLVKEKIAKKAIAADISRGSVEKAQRNVYLYKCAGQIDCRQGDGLSALKKNEYPDVIIAAGMGGMLVIHILKENEAALKKAKRIILQPQRDNDKVRKFMHESGFKIVSEKMFKDEGRIYNIIVCEQGEDCAYSENDYLFGKILISEKNAVLKEYILSELNRMKIVISKLSSNEEHICRRKKELINMCLSFEEVYRCL